MRWSDAAPAYHFEHDKKKHLFVLTAPDGKPEYFRDNPARHLLVEPDPESGGLRPVIMRWKPAYVYLCCEERERGDHGSQGHGPSGGDRGLIDRGLKGGDHVS
jgi:hypothetical protein